MHRCEFPQSGAAARNIKDIIPTQEGDGADRRFRAFPRGWTGR